MKTIKKKSGQVVVELLLTLPLFFLFIFTIMELGNIAYSTLILNHVSYELSRMGSMISGNAYPRESGTAQGSAAGSTKYLYEAQVAMNGQLAELNKKHKKNQFSILSVSTEQTGIDDQQDSYKIKSVDLVVYMQYNVHLLFPGTKSVLGLSTDSIALKTKVRMPIEVPRNG